MNSFLNRFINCQLKLYKFMQNIDRALKRFRHSETFNDYQCGNTTPVYSTHLTSLEKYAVTIYTMNVFFLVWDEIKEEISFSICNCVQDVDRYTYTLKRFGCEYLTWTTCFISSANQIQCLCKLFETLGIPCSYSFSVIKTMNMQNILSSLILTRWTPSTKHMTNIDCVTLTPTMEHARYGSLSAKCNKLCYFASKSNGRFKEADREIEKLTVHMQELMPSSPLTSETVLCPKGKQHVHNARDHGIPATKGYSAHKKTDGGKARKCGNCGKAGHTVKTCHRTQLHNNSTVASNTTHMFDPSCTEKTVPIAFPLLQLVHLISSRFQLTMVVWDI
ncbi:hypothetical protein Ddye_012658 [Dipteronia dyeriana]|uniref:Protein FAR1-RELATED SEQUENCE n=1 Tax=Dipteronia dyeriana TaxID=168575 RepID=A0AAD9X4V6_9ROSI|nr:hypothetical protein Ddye_012658 [Dipteronia dyeriana]